jgi:hypothetical protein
MRNNNKRCPYSHHKKAIEHAPTHSQDEAGVGFAKLFSDYADHSIENQEFAA